VLELHVKIRLLLLAAMHSLLTQPENAALIKANTTMVTAAKE